MLKILYHRILNIRFALAGVVTIFQEEHNIRIFFLWGVAAVTSGFLLRFPAWGITALILSWLIMMSLELMNSAIERTIDMVEPRRDPRVKKIKDIAAASVLLTGMFFAGVWVCLLCIVYF